MQLRALELKDMKRHDTGVSGPQNNLSVGTTTALQKSQQSQSPLNPVVTFNAMSWQYFIPLQHPPKLHLLDIHKAIINLEKRRSSLGKTAPTGHAGSKAGTFPGAWHRRGSGALQSHLLGECKRTSHLQANKFPPSKISPCQKDAGPRTLSGTACPRRYWDPRLSLCSLVLQQTARKRNN